MNYPEFQAIVGLFLLTIIVCDNFTHSCPLLAHTLAYCTWRGCSVCLQDTSSIAKGWQRSAHNCSSFWTSRAAISIQQLFRQGIMYSMCACKLWWVWCFICINWKGTYSIWTLIISYSHYSHLHVHLHHVQVDITCQVGVLKESSNTCTCRSKDVVSGNKN